MNKIAQKLSEARKTKGLTQEELAEKAKINLRTVQRIENSESEPRGKTLSLICEVLEINLKDLILADNSSVQESNIGTKIMNGIFLIALNMILMGIIGFLTLDSNANMNSMFGGFLVSIFLPLFIVMMSKGMSGIERMLKFGSGCIVYFILLMVIHGYQAGFITGWTTGLFPCLLISLSILYFGNELFRNRE